MPNALTKLKNETTQTKHKQTEQTIMSRQQELRDFIQNENSTHPVVVYSKSYCPYCAKTKELFKKLNVEYVVHEIDQHPDGYLLQQELAKLTGQRTVPNVFVGNKHLGGNDDTHNAYRTGALQQLIEAK